MITCMIVEDEWPARELLKSYLAAFPDWELVGDFDNAIDAITYLGRHRVDVIFLDIQLPKLSGIGFLRALTHPPLVVITTAFSEHAVEAFELTVFDYLLKPFPIERFLKTTQRIQAQLQSPIGELIAHDETTILVRADRRNLKLAVNEILYVESQKEYVKIVCRQREVRTRMSISSIESLLATHNFVRVHRSFLVAFDHIDTYSTVELTVGKYAIPIGRIYQRDVKARLG